MIRAANYLGQANEKFSAVAYSLSKMMIVDNDAEFDKFENLLPVEFLEFLGRLAELIYEGQ